jgi:hypothetical protein
VSPSTATIQPSQRSGAAISRLISFGRVVLGDHRLDPLLLLDAAVGVAPASGADSRDALGVVWLGAADDGMHHAGPYVFEGSTQLRRQQITARAAVITSVPVVGPGPLSLSAGR